MSRMIADRRVIQLDDRVPWRIIERDEPLCENFDDDLRSRNRKASIDAHHREEAQILVEIRQISIARETIIRHHVTRPRLFSKVIQRLHPIFEPRNVSEVGGRRERDGSERSIMRRRLIARGDDDDSLHALVVPGAQPLEHVRAHFEERREGRDDVVRTEEDRLRVEDLRENVGHPLLGVHLAVRGDVEDEDVARLAVLDVRLLQGGAHVFCESGVIVEGGEDALGEFDDFPLPLLYERAEEAHASMASRCDVPPRAAVASR